MKNEKTIDALNKLITINNDRIEGYETATDGTEELDLTALFGKFITTSARCKQELVLEVSKRGGKSAEGTLASGKFFRAWMDVKAALTGKDRKAILKSCEFGEEVAIDTYDKVLDNDSEHLGVELQTLITAQKTLLLADYNHVKALRGALASS